VLEKYVITCLHHMTIFMTFRALFNNFQITETCINPGTDLKISKAHPRQL